MAFNKANENDVFPFPIPQAKRLADSLTSHSKEASDYGFVYGLLSDIRTFINGTVNTPNDDTSLKEIATEICEQLKSVQNNFSILFMDVITRERE